MTTFIDEVEILVDILTEWSEDYIDQLLEGLAPDGRPFGTHAQTKEEQLEEYQTIKGSPDRWWQYVDGMAKALMEKLQANGLSPDQIAAVHPYDIAFKRAIAYSVEMEDAISA